MDYSHFSKPVGNNLFELPCFSFVSWGYIFFFFACGQHSMDGKFASSADIRRCVTSPCVNAPRVIAKRSQVTCTAKQTFKFQNDIGQKTNINVPSAYSIRKTVELNRGWQGPRFANLSF